MKPKLSCSCFTHSRFWAPEDRIYWPSLRHLPFHPNSPESENVAPSASVNERQAPKFAETTPGREVHSPKGNQDLLGRRIRFCTSPEYEITTAQRLRKCSNYHNMSPTEYFTPLHVSLPGKRQVVW